MQTSLWVGRTTASRAKFDLTQTAALPDECKGSEADRQQGCSSRKWDRGDISWRDGREL